MFLVSVFPIVPTVIYLRVVFKVLTLCDPIPDEEKKLSKIFIFTLLCGASKGFMKALKAFIKPFETPHTTKKWENENLT